MKRLIYILLAASALLVSCTKETRELAYSKQEALIEKFVTKQAESSGLRVVQNGGATRLVLVEGEGMELTARGKVKVYFALYDFTSGMINGTKLIATNSKEQASSAGWSLTDADYEALELDMTDHGILQGLRDGLAGVQEGEDCYILFTGKYAFGKNNTGTIPANAPLAFRINVLSVEN